MSHDRPLKNIESDDVYTKFYSIYVGPNKMICVPLDAVFM